MKSPLYMAFFLGRGKIESASSVILRFKPPFSGGPELFCLVPARERK